LPLPVGTWRRRVNLQNVYCHWLKPSLKLKTAWWRWSYWDSRILDKAWYESRWTLLPKLWLHGINVGKIKRRAKSEHFFQPYGWKKCSLYSMFCSSFQHSHRAKLQSKSSSTKNFLLGKVNIERCLY
jgi:hypothetical protein